MRRDWLGRLRQGFRKAFSLQSPYGPLTGDDQRFMKRLAESIVARGLAMPAIMALTSIIPLGGIASQALTFLRPFQGSVHSLLRPFLNRLFDEKLLENQKDYDQLIAILDRREGVEAMVQAIEDAQALNKDLLK